MTTNLSVPPISIIDQKRTGHYIGRSSPKHAGSALANPFKVAGSNRKDVVEAFRYYLAYTVLQKHPVGASARIAGNRFNLTISTAWAMPTRQEVIDELNTLLNELKNDQPLTLQCYCYKDTFTWGDKYQWHCHGEAIAALLKHLLKNNIVLE